MSTYKIQELQIFIHYTIQKITSKGGKSGELNLIKTLPSATLKSSSPPHKSQTLEAFQRLQRTAISVFTPRPLENQLHFLFSASDDLCNVFPSYQLW